ncbi:hypothetical protein K402DRAFT_1786 [Aulographum hederae CBS 113979]|uniref:Uncharacterized protein n=1 Tax=Aulographum hederae CBS 113979 TaxID=1176131 RepID=A0A6G1HG99_9PEZI|nr:hypothetical protein K402DRAFT_1786 [Aulographum hederae CBS 113979]
MLTQVASILYAFHEGSKRPPPGFLSWKFYFSTPTGQRAVRCSGSNISMSLGEGFGVFVMSCWLLSPRLSTHSILSGTTVRPFFTARFRICSISLECFIFVATRHAKFVSPFSFACSSPFHDISPGISEHFIPRELCLWKLQHWSPVLVKYRDLRHTYLPPSLTPQPPVTCGLTRVTRCND